MIGKTIAAILALNLVLAASILFYAAQAQLQQQPNNSTNSNSTIIGESMSETLWETEVRERRTLAGLSPVNNSTLPNMTKSPESLEIDQLQAQDPKFANFEAILDQCYNNGDADPTNNIIPHSQCQARLEEASAAWCGVETYDAIKCDYVSNQSTWYEAMYSIFSLLQSP